MLTAEGPLDRAIKAITISEAWRRLGLQGTPKKSCRVPWRDDRNPSLTIFNDDRRFYDHGTGDGGDVVKFISLATDMNMSDAAKLLIEWNGRYSSYSPARSFQRTTRTSRPALKHAEKERKELVIPDMDKGSINPDPGHSMNIQNFAFMLTIIHGRKVGSPIGIGSATSVTCPVTQCTLWKYRPYQEKKLPNTYGSSEG